MRTSLLTLLFLFSFCLLVPAQQTVGVFTNDETALESYTLFSPFRGTNSYLVDNCGRLINIWDREEPVGLAAYFLPNGQLLRTIQVENVQGPFYSASSAGATELVDWDNNTVWRYDVNTDSTLSHHDVKFLPNGHVLILCWETMDQNELFDLGRDAGLIRTGDHNLEYIIEVIPQGNIGGEIIWEWHLRDHLVQELNENQNNFGIVADHPELMDINFQTDDLDWTHFNAIDYNDVLDQIVISVRNFSEVWILDHSTSSEEAAGHIGGDAMSGGDILYRWGNPQVYDNGSTTDRKLYNQHGVNWIEPGLVDEGKIIIFNNGFGRGYSSVEIIESPLALDKSYDLDPSGAFGPDTIFDSYGYIGLNFYSMFLSNAQRLPNGHIFINEGGDGRLFEIDENDNIVWEYISPVVRDFITPQGSTVNRPSIFRSYTYPLNYEGFDGLDILPGELLEGDSEYNHCETVTSVEELTVLNVQLNQENNSLQIINRDNHNIQGKIYGLTGQLIQQFESKESFYSVDMSEAQDQILFIDYIVNFEFRRTLKISNFKE